MVYFLALTLDIILLIIQYQWRIFFVYSFFKENLHFKENQILFKIFLMQVGSIYHISFFYVFLYNYFYRARGELLLQELVNCIQCQIYQKHIKLGIYYDALSIKNEIRFIFLHFFLSKISYSVIQMHQKI